MVCLKNSQITYFQSRLSRGGEVHPNFLSQNRVISAKSFFKISTPQFLIRQRDPSFLKQFTCSKLVRFILQVSTKTYENKMKQKLSKLKKTFLFTIPLRINFFRKTIFRNNKPTRDNTA